MKGYPGVDPRDELWLARELTNPTPDGDGVCFAVLNGEQIGPFSCKADAEAALDRKLAGTDLAPGADGGSVIFADPATYHVPTSPEGALNA